MADVEWSPQLIQMIKQYPIIYRHDIPRTGKEYKIALNIAWNEIEKKLGISKRSCKQVWRNKKLKYAKLKLLFNSGTLSEDLIKAYKDTSRYFDGTLSFLDPHISEITEATIPLQIHKQVNKLFDLKDSYIQTKINSTPVVTHEQIIRLLNKKQKDGQYSDNTDMQRLQNLVESVVKRKVNDLFPLNVIPSSDSDKEIKLGLQSEIIIEDHVKMEETDRIVEEDFVQTESEDENDKTESQILPSINMSDEVIGDGPFNLSDSEIIVTITDKTKITSQIINEPSRISDTNMKKFFNELGEVIGVELSKEKQVLLKKRLNTLLQKI